MLGVFDTKHFADFRPHQAPAQGAKDSLFEFALADREAAGTRPFVPCRGASVLGRADLGEAAAALAAFEQKRKQLPWPTLRSEVAFLSERLLTRLRLVPQFVIDDPQMRNVGTHPCRLVVEPSGFPARVRVLIEGLLSPDLPTDIQLIEEDARLAPPVAVDAARAPRAAGRTGNALHVQLKGNFPGRLPAAIVAENPADDLRLGFIDMADAADTLPARVVATLNVVAIAFAPGALAFHGALLQAAMSPAGEVFDVHHRHRAFETDMQGRNLAFHEGDDADSAMTETLVHVRDVFLVAAEAINGFHQDRVKQPFMRSREQLLQTGPHHV